MGAALKLYPSERTLDELAELIRQNERKINFPLRTSLKAAAQSGAWACEAKSKVKHGEWQQWVMALGKPAPSTLRRYMQIFKYPERANKVNTIKDFTRFGLDVDKAVRKEIRVEEIEKAKLLLAQGKLPLESNWKLHHANCREFNWPMMDYWIFDPPWPRKANEYKELEHYEWCARIAKEKLKPGGLLFAQCSDEVIGKVFPIFKDFTEIRTLCLFYKQGDAAGLNAFLSNWSPVLLFSKGKAILPEGVRVTSAITVEVNTSAKQYHEWAQPLPPFVRWIEALTLPGSLVGDPFACTATYGVACKLTARRYLGTEIRPDMVAMGRKLIRDVK